MSTQPTATLTNRRRYQRIPIPSPALVVTATEIATHPVRDISAGGIFVLASQAPRVGSQVRVEFDLGRAGHFSLMGMVNRDETTNATPETMGFAIEFEVQDRERDAVTEALLRA